MTFYSTVYIKTRIKNCQPQKFDICLNTSQYLNIASPAYEHKNRRNLIK